MPINVPNAVNYASPLISVPTKYQNPPKETPRMIQCEIDWGTMGGPNNAINLNLSNNQQLEFSQIVALSIDNHACGSDVEFIFPDTGSSISIPAYSPYVVVPVFTNALSFYIYSPGAEVEDVTYFSIQNSLPPPIAVPTSQEQQAAAVADINGGTAASTAIIAAGINGTVEGVNISWASNTGSGGGGMGTLIDGDGNIVAVVNATNGQSGNLFSLQMSKRFLDGLNFVIAAGTTLGGMFSVNVYYRIP